jgi:hypothetical protein
MRGMLVLAFDPIELEMLNAAAAAAGQPGILRPGLSCFVTSTRTGYVNRLTQAIDGTGYHSWPTSLSAIQRPTTDES